MSLNGYRHRNLQSISNLYMIQTLFVIRSMKAENYQVYMEAEAGFQSNMGTADYFRSPFLKYALSSMKVKDFLCIR